MLRDNKLLDKYPEVIKAMGESVAKDFSANTFTPLETAYSNISGRKAAWVVKSTTSLGPRQSIAFL